MRPWLPQLRFAALDACPEFQGDKGNAWIDMVGAGLPVRPLAPLETRPAFGFGGLYAAASAPNGAGRPLFREMARRLVHDGWVCAEMFSEGDGLGGRGLWDTVCAEGEALMPHMKPGKLMLPDGSAVHGISPSGAKRGDVTVYVQEDVVSRGLEAPALLRLNESVVRVAQALADALAEFEREPNVPFKIAGCSDGKFARFPGDGSGYNAHTDGTKAGVVLTSILYTNPGWEEAHGGELRMLDETGGPADWCWRSVAPKANRFLWFRHKVLHKVCPAFAPRYAFTHFWFKA